VNSSATVVDLLRHGEPVGGRRFRGKQDDPLSYRGWTQMRAALRPFAPSWQSIITSPLRRCAEFADELSGMVGIGSCEWPDFQEMGFGEWEGRTAESLLEEQPDVIEAFWRDPVNFSPPNGEGLVEFSRRIMGAWGNLIEQHAGEHVLLIAHGGVIRVILAETLGMPLDNLYRIEVPYASLSRLRIFGSGADRRPMLIFHGSR